MDGWFHSCKIETNGTVQCWEINWGMNGGYGRGQSTIPAYPGTFSSISAGSNHTCVVKTDGTAQCWGNDASGAITVPAILQ